MRQSNHNQLFYDRFPTPYTKASPPEFLRPLYGVLFSPYRNIFIVGKA